MRLSLPALLLLASVGPITGCPKNGAAAASAPTAGAAATSNVSAEPASMLTTTKTADGLTQEQVDLNRDGRPEITNFYRERSDAPRLLLRKDTDLNLDGKVDVRTTFDDAGQRTTEEMDGDFDGRTDWVDHYISGRRTVSDVDTDFNGSFDLFKYYENGKVRRKERDTNADGRIDAWEYLDDNGVVTKTGRDIDGDGKMDVREQ
jgi:hypothetical protein